MEKLPLGDKFTGPDLMAAMEGHVLGKAAITGVYTLNPELAGSI